MVAAHGPTLGMEEPLPTLAVMLAVGTLCTAGVMRAQPPPLAPTSDITIVVNGTLHYSSILVPTGVTVRFVRSNFYPPPSMPAVVLCDGDAIVHGRLSVGAGTPGVGMLAGTVLTGRGANGYSCQSYSFPAMGGLHAGNYGSVLPFSLEGGSPGGDFWIYSDLICQMLVFPILSGSEGGGTLALLAGGRVEVDGTVTADGTAGSYPAGSGSGGSILLRGAAGVTVMPVGRVTARGGGVLFAGAPGYVRFDAWGAPPIIQGTVAPTPTVLELPHLRTLIPPRIGTSWQCEVFAPESAAVFVAASPTQGSGAPTPFGPLGIDLPSATILAYAAITPPGHDPFVNVSTPVPNAQPLVGLTFWVQALVAPPALPTRLSNTIAVVVQ